MEISFGKRAPLAANFPGMRDIPIEELAPISAEIHEAAARLGCTHVSITGQIWPGGQLSGAPEEAARFVEFSWHKAAVLNGRAIFEEADPNAYAALLNRHGLGDEPPLELPREVPVTKEAPALAAPAKIELTAQVLPATKRELERQAKAEGLTVAELLDWKFQPRPGR